MKRVPVLLVVGLLLACTGCKPYFGNVRINDRDDLADYSEYTHIFGNLIIEQTALVNLDGLQGLQAVYGSVSIHDNGLLLSLGGLQGLEVIGGNLLIHNHLVLNHLGLSGLRRVNGNFQITNNHMLLDAQALALKHQVITADGIGGAIIISGNLL